MTLFKLQCYVYVNVLPQDFQDLYHLILSNLYQTYFPSFFAVLVSFTSTLR